MTSLSVRPVTFLSVIYTRLSQKRLYGKSPASQARNIPRRASSFRLSDELARGLIIDTLTKMIEGLDGSGTFDCAAGCGGPGMSARRGCAGSRAVNVRYGPCAFATVLKIFRLMGDFP